jgi:hypothetical protein
MDGDEKVYGPVLDFIPRFIPVQRPPSNHSQVEDHHRPVHEQDDREQGGMEGAAQRYDSWRTGGPLQLLTILLSFPASLVQEPPWGRAGAGT